MRDQHKRKDDLVQENAALRQQVLDLKDEAKARHRVEQHLRESVGRYRDVFELIPIGAGWFDRDGRVTLANRALAHILGYKSGAELVALAGAVPVVREEEWARLMAELPECDEPTTMTVSLHRKDGTVSPTSLRVTRADGGGLIMYLNRNNGS